MNTEAKLKKLDLDIRNALVAAAIALTIEEKLELTRQQRRLEVTMNPDTQPAVDGHDIFIPAR